MIYVGSQVDGNRSFSIPRLNTDPYFIANLAAEYDVGKGVTVFARANNFFDERYQDPTGFQRPGFGVYGGVRVNFEVAGAKKNKTESYTKESPK